MHISRVNCDIMGKKREDLGRGKLAEMAEIQILKVLYGLVRAVKFQKAFNICRFKSTRGADGQITRVLELNAKFLNLAG